MRIIRTLSTYIELISVLNDNQEIDIGALIRLKRNSVLPGLHTNPIGIVLSASPGIFTVMFFDD